MAIKQTTTLLKELLKTGGMEIVTPDPFSPAGSDPQIAIRTVIQPDGDIIMTITPTVFSHPDLWENHMKRVNDLAGSISRIRALFDGSVKLSFPIGLVLITAGIHQGLKDQLFFATAGLLFGLVSGMFKFICRVALRRFAQLERL